MLVPALRSPAPLPARPAAAGAARGRAAAAEPAATESAADVGPVLRGPIGGPGAGTSDEPRRSGPGAVAEAAYRFAAGLRPAPPADAVELSTRTLAGGGRLTVARRSAGGVTVGIEALVG